jgi:hypothetical protein
VIFLPGGKGRIFLLCGIMIIEKKPELVDRKRNNFSSVRGGRSKSDKWTNKWKCFPSVHRL